MKRILVICGLLVPAVGVLSWATPGSEEEERGEAWAEARDARRSFTGAPPVIPHQVFRKDNQECLHCHLEVKKTPFGLSNITPHPEWQNCQQCHVGTQWLNADLPVSAVPNSFEGWVGETEGFRSHELAPPTVPHGLRMRENCNSCHAADHPDARLRGPHPERLNCRQCHVQQNPEF